MQKTLTVIARIKPGDAAQLESTLDIIGQDVRGAHNNSFIRLLEFNTVHFCRWVMIPNDITGQKEHLLFVSYYDGSLRDHLNEFVERAGEAIDRIWGSCVGYPLNRTANPEKFKRQFYAFIVKHSYDYAARHIGYYGEQVPDIRRYGAVRDTIVRFLDLRQVEKFVSEDLKALVALLPELAPPIWVRSPILRWLQTQAQNIVRLLTFILDFLWHILLFFVIWPPLRRLQGRSPDLNLQLDWTKEQPGLLDLEDLVVQNQLTVISRIRPGLREYVRLRLALIFIGMVAKYFQTEGSLGGIATIHFAHWSIINRGRHLLFISNYDGSWDSYIGDFSDKAASGLDLIWRSAPDYPERGARDLEKFKAVIRMNQVRTQAFYSAYPNWTVRNIRNNREISHALDRSRVQSWLRRL